MQPEERLTICASISSALEDCRAGTPAHKRSRNKQPRYVESGKLTVEKKSGEKKHVNRAKFSRRPWARFIVDLRVTARLS